MRKPDVPCSVCGKLLYGGRGSLPAGARTCRPCRSARATRRKPEPHACPVCETPTTRPVFCRRRCGELDKLRRRRAGLTGAKARTCEICGADYRPKYPEQRTCGRACGWQLRLNEGTAQAARPRVRQLALPRVRTCSHCHALFMARRRNYCSAECAAEAKLIRDREYRRALSRPYRTCMRCGRRRTPTKRRVLCDPCLRITKRNRKRRERRRIKNLIRNVISEPVHARGDSAA